MDFLRRLFGQKQKEEKEDVPPASRELTARGIDVGWVTDIGQQRMSNEDSILIMQADQEGENTLSSFGLFILADGMGGHKSGEVVSALAVRVMARHVIQQVYLASLSHRGHSAEQPSIKEVLVEGSNLANATVSEMVPGGGTTLTCALLLGNQAYLANIGDSRAYFISSDGLEQITRDHSLVDRLIELGQLTEEEAATHPQKNVLYRAVGQGGVLEVDTFVHSVRPGQGILLCSDGLWGLVKREDIARIIAEAPSAQAACDALAEMANQAGGRDNISAILAQFPSVS